MKKLLLNTIVLLSFSIAIIIFQISCKKTADASPTPVTTGVTQQNKILYVGTGSSGKGVYTANYDGTGMQYINIAIPTDRYIAAVSMSPDQKTLFIRTNGNSSYNGDAVYSCNSDGSNLKLLPIGYAIIGSFY